MCAPARIEAGMDPYNDRALRSLRSFGAQASDCSRTNSNNIWNNGGARGSLGTNEKPRILEALSVTAGAGFEPATFGI
jgi:hypothetical protein